MSELKIALEALKESLEIIKKLTKVNPLPSSEQPIIAENKTSKEPYLDEEQEDKLQKQAMEALTAIDSLGENEEEE